MRDNAEIKFDQSRFKIPANFDLLARGNVNQVFLEMEKSVFRVGVRFSGVAFPNATLVSSNPAARVIGREAGASPANFFSAVAVV